MRPSPRQKVIGKWSGGGEGERWNGSFQNMAAIQRTLLWYEMNSQAEEEEEADAISACGGAEDAIIGRLLILSITQRPTRHRFPTLSRPYERGTGHTSPP